LAYYPLHIIVIAATVAMVAGLLAGWMVAHLALSKPRRELAVSNRRLNAQRMELERERFNLSRLHLHSDAGPH